MKTCKNLGIKILAVLTALVLILSLTLIVGIDSNWGKVEITRLTLVSADGDEISALMYKPKTASPENKVPMLMVNHGGSDMFEQMVSYALEPARRGDGAITLEHTGAHNSDNASGLSEGNKEKSGGPTMGAETVWNTVKTFNWVDMDKIILMGHSMGGQYTMSFSIEHQEEVFLQVNIGMNNYGKKENQDHNFHFANVLGIADESTLARTENDVTRTLQGEQLRRIFFGDYTSDAADLPLIELGKDYTVTGTNGKEYNRVTYVPDSCHAYYLVTNDAIQTVLYAVTSQVGIGLDPGVNSYADHNKISTVWQWKEVGFILLAAGTVMLMLLIASALLKTKIFSGLVLKPVAADLGFKKGSPWWWIALAVLFILPVALYRPGILASRSFLGINISKLWLLGGTNNAYISWQWTVSLALLAVFLVYHFVWARKRGGNLRTYGFATSDEGGFKIGYVLKALAFGLITVGGAYAAFSLICGYTQQGMHIATWMISPLNPKRTGAVVMYFLFQIPYFLTSSLAMKALGTDKYENNTKGILKTIGWGMLVSVGGIFLLWLAFIVVLCNAHIIIPGTFFSSDRMYIYTIAILPLFIGMSVANALNIYVNKKTNSIWTGLFTALLWGAWIITSCGGLSKVWYF